MKATERYFYLALFIMLYKVVLTFESEDEILKCDTQMKAIEQYFPVVLFFSFACLFVVNLASQKL